jgi:hypothetical protein
MASTVVGAPSHVIAAFAQLVETEAFLSSLAGACYKDGRAMWGDTLREASMRITDVINSIEISEITRARDAAGE